MLTGVQTQKELPLLEPLPSIKISGGGRLDGKAYLTHLQKRAEEKGVTIIQEHVQLTDDQTISYGENKDVFDQIALTAGPHLKELLAPLDYRVDLRPQKGQLLVFQTALKKAEISQLPC